MAKTKFKFNPNTLNFEKITFGLRDYLLTGLRYLFAGTIIGGIGVVIYASFFKDPQTERLSREIDFLESQLDALNSQVDTLRLFANELEQSTGHNMSVRGLSENRSAIGQSIKSIEENFADGRVKGKSRPGRVKRAGASCNGSVTDLRRRAKNASGEKAKMYHWCANMKSGRKK